MAQEELAFVREKFAEPLPPPSTLVGPIAWMRANLFSSPMNSVATVLAIVFVAWVIWSIIDWLIFDAVFSGENREACLGSPDGGPPGACWAFIKAKFSQFIYGRYPIGERWRVNIVFFLFAALLIPMAIPKAPYKRENGAAPARRLSGRRAGPPDRRQFRFQRIDEPDPDRRPRRRNRVLAADERDGGDGEHAVPRRGVRARSRCGAQRSRDDRVLPAGRRAFRAFVSTLSGVRCRSDRWRLGLPGQLSIILSVVSLIMNWTDPNARRVSIAGGGGSGRRVWF